MIKNTVGETKVRKAVNNFFTDQRSSGLSGIPEVIKKAPSQNSLWVWYWAGELGLVFPTKLIVASSKSFELRVDFTAEAHVSTAMIYIPDSKAKTQTRAFKCRSL